MNPSSPNPLGVATVEDSEELPYLVQVRSGAIKRSGKLSSGDPAELVLGEATSDATVRFFGRRRTGGGFLKKVVKKAKSVVKKVVSVAKKVVSKVTGKKVKPVPSSCDRKYIKMVKKPCADMSNTIKKSEPQGDSSWKCRAGRDGEAPVTCFARCCRFTKSKRLKAMELAANKLNSIGSCAKNVRHPSSCRSELSTKVVHDMCVGYQRCDLAVKAKDYPDVGQVNPALSHDT